MMDTVKNVSVYVYGYYGAGNLGDELLAKSVVKGLGEKRRKITYYFRSIDIVDSLSSNKNIFFPGLEKLLIGHKTLLSKMIAFFRYTIGHFRIFRKCQYFVLGGGTLISSRISLTTIFLLSWLVFLARINGVKVYGMGLGVVFVENKIRRLLAGYVLKNCEILYVRDLESLNAANDMLSDSRAVLTSDLVYSLYNQKFSVNKLSHERINIGISLAQPFLNESQYKNEKRKVLSVLSEVVKNWGDNDNYAITFISFQELVLQDGVRISDSDIFNELGDLCGDVRPEIQILKDGPESISNIFSELDVFVGMRFHGAVLSAIYSIPFVGFSVDEKVAGICREYEMPYSNLINLTTDWLLRSVDVAIKSKVDSGITARLAEDSKKNFSFMTNGIS